MNLVDLFEATALRQPDHEAFVDPSQGVRYSYRALALRIRDAGARLIASGIRSGDCVGLLCPSGVDYIVFAYALWSCGATVVPIPCEMSLAEKAAICHGIHLDRILVRDQDADTVRTLAAGGAIAVLEAQTQVIQPPATRVHPDGFRDINAAFLRFTSGTTAASKGVVLSHETVRDRILAANRGLEIGPSDTVLWLLSMSYHFTVSIVAYLTFGARIVQCRDVTGRTIVSIADRERATIIYGAPTHYALMCRDHSGVGLPALRRAISTTSPLRSDTAAKFHRLFGTPIGEAYGIIEIGLPCVNLDAVGRKPGSVGRPLPDYELRFRDMALGDSLRAIEVRGAGMLDAYYDPWRTRETITDEGWFATGDLGYQDDDGYVYLLARSNGVINVAGMKLFPQEVEAVLEQHPAVVAALVYAEADPVLGETPCADVVLNSAVDPPPSAPELRAHCLEQLVPYKVPRSIRFVSQLPQTASGKLRRRRPEADGH